MSIFEKPLFIYEIANNHQGNVEHGTRIIREMRKVSEPYRDRFDFAIKFQYRNLDTFIHPDYQDRDDIKNEAIQGHKTGQWTVCRIAPGSTGGWLLCNLYAL